jgi:hypothetical protein
MGYGVIGNTGDSGSSVLGSSPGTPAKFNWVPDGEGGFNNPGRQSLPMIAGGGFENVRNVKQNRKCASGYTQGVNPSCERREDKVLGAIVGDIVGSVYEWNNLKSKDFPLFGTREGRSGRMRESRFTDDTVMTMGQFLKRLSHF